MSTVLPITVIIPSYNSRVFLGECIRSINAGVLPAEIIIIDDCSTDGSLDVAIEIEKNNKNVRVIALKNNSGALEARREGVLAATQGLISMVDADDLLEEHALSSAYETIIKTKTDICIWDLQRFEENRQWSIMTIKPEMFPMSGQQAALMTLGGWKIHPFGIIRKSIYTNAYEGFKETCFNADELLTRLVFLFSGTVSFCNKKYLYRAHSSSITKEIHPRLLSSLDACLWLVDFCKNLDGAPVRAVTLDVISRSWWLFKKRKELGLKATKYKIGISLHNLHKSGELSTWVFKHPKHTIAFIFLSLYCHSFKKSW